MQCIIGVTTNDPRDLSKSFKSRQTVDVKWVEESSIIDPILEIEKFDGWAGCNYFYFKPDASSVGRYYFITNLEMVDYAIIRITGHVDVLNTWKGYIKSINTLIERQENIWSPYIQDSLLPVKTDRILNFKKIGNIGNPKGQNIVLTVGGGKHLE